MGGTRSSSSNYSVNWLRLGREEESEFLESHRTCLYTLSTGSQNYTPFQHFVSAEGCVSVLARDVCVSCNFVASTSTPFAGGGVYYALSSPEFEGVVDGSKDDLSGNLDIINKRESIEPDSDGEGSQVAVCVSVHQ